MEAFRITLIQHSFMITYLMEEQTVCFHTLVREFMDNTAHVATKMFPVDAHIRP